MGRISPLFVMGNKRSGTSLLCKILNCHPQIYVSFESDVVWLIWQMVNGNEDFVRYPWDGDSGLRNTLGYVEPHLERMRDELRRTKDVQGLYENIQEIVRVNTKWARVKDADKLAYVGDKKPVQYADPEIFEFICKHFWQPVFLHIVRHPHASVGSMKRKSRGKRDIWPPFWNESEEAVLERWVQHERWVIRAKEKAPVFSLRFEDLCYEPHEELGRLFEFLGLEVPTDRIKPEQYKNTNNEYRGRGPILTPEAKEIMRIYGY